MPLEAQVAVRAHVAGPPERERRDNAAGWDWTQRCLRCDTEVYAGEWWLLGATVVELGDGTMTDEAPPGSAPGSAAPCQPED